MGSFGSVITAMVTPFEEDGGLSTAGAATLAGWLVENGTDGLVLAGTTGEGSTLSDAEVLALIRTVREAVSVPLIAGTGSNSTSHAVELTRRAAETGADAILTVTPYYNRPSQAGIEHHFRAVAEAAGDLPVLLYDIPFRTGRKIETATLLRLAREVPNIVGLKDAAGDVSATARLVAEAPEGFEVYCGEDRLVLPLLSVGAVGTISVASHWCGRQIGEMITAFGKGDVVAARRINAQLGASYEFESSDDAPNPVPTKALLRTLGLPSGPCRPPMGPVPPGLDELARSVLANLN